MRLNKRVLNPSWTPEDLARVHEELDRVAREAEAIVLPAQAALAVDDTAFAAATEPPVPMAGPGEFDLRAALRDLRRALLTAPRGLALTIAAPAVLLGLILCRQPLGMRVHAAAILLAGIALITFAVPALWEAMARAELSRGAPPSYARLDPYWRFDRHRLVLVAHLVGLTAAIYAGEYLCVSLAAFLVGVFWPLSGIVLAVTWAAVACALFCGVALIADGPRGVATMLRLLRPAQRAHGLMTLGAMVAIVPAMLAESVLRHALVWSDVFAFFNPLAAVGLAGLLLSLMPLSRYFAAFYRRVLAGRR